ncbi:MAG: DNA-3-methyladenine glycosylase [Ignavibacteria bacterium]|nr:DNA-3-methyladenine glycosylase [Ignavibacteria bacterium]
MNYKPLPRKFYHQDTVTVSQNLLGKIIVRKIRNKLLAAKIVETEAYIGEHDPACHAYQKITNRSSTLYEIGGTVYVYFIYGNYYCFNIVTEEKGVGCAVLIRAVEPLQGIDTMKKYRPSAKSLHELTNGPSKFCLTFNIDRTLNKEDLLGKKIFISNPLDKMKFEICVSRRIGLNIGKEFQYRFFIKDNPFVTKHKINKEAKTLI